MTDPHPAAPDDQHPSALPPSIESVMAEVDDFQAGIAAGVGELSALALRHWPDGPPDPDIAAALDRITTSAENMGAAADRMRTAALAARAARAETN